MKIKLIADSGSTKCEWCLLINKKNKRIITKGISPYFLNEKEIELLIHEELFKKIKQIKIDEIYFYGTGLKSASNILIIKKVLKKIFPSAKIFVHDDLIAAARSLCGKEKGIVCILGTGSNSCYYDGKKKVKNNPGLGYILGDEGSGTYLGKKIIQYYLYGMFDEILKKKFDEKYKTTAAEILDKIYKQPLPNRYLASFSVFVAENRGHQIIDNIIEDSINDFFSMHILKYKESQSLPINFTGSIAFIFKDAIKEACKNYNLKLGKIVKEPMQGLIAFHNNK